jgi:hypothetical protein
MGVFDNLKKDFDVTELDHAGLLYYGKNNLIYFMGGLLIFYRMGDEIVYVNQRKYPGSKGVKYNGLMGKAKHFYCLNPESDVLTVVEGEIDALAFCHITGSDKVIACGGVVNARPRKLDNYLAQMCYGKKRKYQFVLDSDEAGAKTVKALKEAGEIAMTVDEYCIDYGIGAGYKDFGEVLERKAAMDRAG